MTLEETVQFLEAQISAQCEAIASLERAARNFKPINLGRPENAALAMIVASVDDVSEPFVRPAQINYGLRPRETRPREMGETRAEEVA